MLPLVLHHADLHTMNRARPRAGALLIRDGRIAAVGTDADVRAAAGTRYDAIDCGGDLLLPAFVDAHIHLLAYAAGLASVDCSPAAAPDIPALLAAIAARAVISEPGRWIRAVGYRETELRERRHPTRWELDAAAPANPVRLIHASGHGCVLNSRALWLSGIGLESEEPAGGHIGRRLKDGEPDGLLLGMNAAVERAVPPAEYADLRTQVAEADRRLLAQGITAVQDMGVQNDAATLAMFERLRQDGALSVALTPAIGIEPFLAGNLPPGWTGMVKIVIEELGDELHPDAVTLGAQIGAIHARGARAAVHCIGRQAVQQAIAAFETLAQREPIRARRHRLEHAALCRPQEAGRAAALGLLVVCNPGLLRPNGDRYLRDLPAGDLPWLHNPATFAAAGIPVAIGSDAPVGPPDALGSIAAAASRLSASGQRLPGKVAPLADALRAHTLHAANAGGSERERGALRPGAAADLVRLPAAAFADPAVLGGSRPRVMQAGIWRDGGRE
ncbi:MAG TPA: amidohydrolase family protein [Dehalococcoidia bacterium]|nr:amidohydrolase family protein [Dehalococcoidia bacterium]